MPIEAPISELALFDLLQLISLTAKSGILSLTDKETTKTYTIYFDNGKLVYIDLTDKIREEMVKRELVDNDEVYSLEGDNLIEYIVKRQLMSSNTFNILYRKIAMEVIYSLFTINSGQISFKESDFSVPYSLDLGEKIENVILEAARRIDEISKMEEIIPSRDIVLEVSSDIIGMESINLDRMEWELISLIDGKRTIADLIREKGDELKVLKSLYGLIMTGIVTEKRIELNNIVKDEVAKDDEITGKLRELRKRWSKGEYEKGIEILSHLRKRHPDDTRIIYELGFYYLAEGRFKRTISEWDSYLLLSENELQKEEIKENLELVMELFKKISSREVS
ncbi:hypothetical protein ES703_112429 [subsurface metagenome]